MISDRGLTGMDLSGFFKKQSELYNTGRIEEIPAFFEEWLDKTDAEGDKGARVTILNEMMGFYREKSLHDKSISCGEEAARLMQEMNMAGTIPYAMTLLNAATVYRAAGKYQESAERYAEVFAIFHEQLSPTDFKFAEANNNVALLYQELGRFDKAVEALERALAICRDTPHKEFETAVTLANLGNCEIEEGELGAAIVDLTEAVEIFTDEEASDTHHAAAITGLADVDVKLGRVESAKDGYLRAMKMVEEYIGQNDDYRRIEEKYDSLNDADAESQNGVNNPDDDTAADSKTNNEAANKRLTSEKDTTGFGLKLARHFYETFGREMIETKFPDYAGRIAVGKAGSGSECFGFDDSFSRDHDFGPGFSMWLTDEDYEKIGDTLSKEYEAILERYISEKIYEQLPEYREGKVGDTSEDAAEVQSSYRNDKAAKRTGVRKISDFYKEHTGFPGGPLKEGDYLVCEEHGLAAAVNGEVYRDDLGTFTGIREKLK